MYIVKSKELLDSFQRLNRAIKRRSAMLSPESHGRAQGRVLRIIAAYDGINARDLANLLEIKPPSLTAKLNKLEADGNIIRKHDERDGRFTYIYITPAGYANINRREDDEQSLKKDFCDYLTEEEKIQFCSICDRLSIRLNAIIDEERRMQDAQRLAKCQLFFAEKKDKDIG